jgi:pimeloyl-ACP methyl ester carboxylesterase
VRLPGFALHHQHVTAPGAEPTKWTYTIHGILGRGGNWRSFARKLVAARPDWGALLVDLREHGKSLGAPPPHTVRAAALDLVDLAGVLEADGKHIRGIVGHSLGGKVALRYRALSDERLLQTWVIDATPGADPNATFGPRGIDTTVGVLRVLEHIPVEVASRKAFMDEAVSRGLSEPMAAWLAMNWESSGSVYARRIDLASMRALLEDYYAQDLWQVVEDERLPGELHVVVAGKSSAVSASDRVTLASLEATGGGKLAVHDLPTAGHWVHVDALDELVDLVASSLP